jgi:uncharacterized protein with PIN domain
MSGTESRKKAAAARRQLIRAKERRAEIPLSPGNLQPAFVADVMLGRLAKWLRIAGFDVLYSNRFGDDELVALSRQQERILLSRDTRLLLRKAVDRFVFLESEQIEEQLAQVFKATSINVLPGILTRCLACNRILLDIPRDQIRDRVPPFVFETQRLFKSCPDCRRVYWAGTHRQAVLNVFRRILPEV